MHCNVGVKHPYSFQNQNLLLIHILNDIVTTFSQAVLVDRTMYISGQIGMDISGQLVVGGVEAQAKQVWPLNNS